MSHSTIRYSGVPGNSQPFTSGSDHRPKPVGSDRADLAARWRSRLAGVSEEPSEGSRLVRALPFTPGKTPDGWTETRTRERGANEWPHPENPGLITDYDGHYDWAGRRLFLSDGTPDPATPGAYRYQTRPDLCDPSAPDSEPVSPRYEPMWLRHKPGDIHQFGAKPFDPDDAGPFGNPLWRPDRRTGRHRYAELPDPIAPWDWQPGDPEPPDFARTGIRWKAHGNWKPEEGVDLERGDMSDSGRDAGQDDDSDPGSGFGGGEGSFDDREYESGLPSSAYESAASGRWYESEQPGAAYGSGSNRSGAEPEPGRTWPGRGSRIGGAGDAKQRNDDRPSPSPSPSQSAGRGSGFRPSADPGVRSGPDSESGSGSGSGVRRRWRWEDVERRGGADVQSAAEPQGFRNNSATEAPHRFSKNREEALHNFLAYSEPFAEANRVGWARAARVGRIRQTAIERECGATIALLVCVIRWIVGLIKGTAAAHASDSAAEQSEALEGFQPKAADPLGGHVSRGSCGVNAARFFNGVRQGFAAASAVTATSAAAVATGATAETAAAATSPAAAEVDGTSDASATARAGFAATGLATPAAAPATGDTFRAGTRVGESIGNAFNTLDLLTSTIGLERVRDNDSSGRSNTRASAREGTMARVWRSRPSQSSPFPARPRSRPAPYIAAWEREFDSKARIQGLAFGGAL
jgi:hypothetical protein